MGWHKYRGNGSGGAGLLFWGVILFPLFPLFAYLAYKQMKKDINEAKRGKC